MARVLGSARHLALEGRDGFEALRAFATGFVIEERERTGRAEMTARLTTMNVTIRPR